MSLPHRMVGAVQAVIRAVLTPLRLFVEWLRIRTSPRTQTMGFSLVCTDPDTESEAFFALAAEALRVIGQWDPRRLSRMQKDVRVFGVSATSSSHYEPAMQGVFVAPSVLASGWPEYVAATFVHEAMHGRLRRLGNRHYWRNRPRHEEICAQAEREFATRVPNSDALLEAIDRRQSMIDWNREPYGEVHAFLKERARPAWTRRVAAVLQWVSRRRS